MDESWRVKMGVSGTSARSSSLEPEDFDDVFGGPPKSVIARKLSADFSGNDWFYSEIFKPLELHASDIVSGCRLPEFVVPEKRRSKNKQVKSMSRSKSTSSSVMSLDELYQLNHFGSSTVIAEQDVALSSFTSKLRPINIPKASNRQRRQDLPAFGCLNSMDLNDNKVNVNQCNDYKMKSKFEYPQSATSPEIPNTQPTSFNTSTNNGEYELQLSPPSPISSLCHALEDSRMMNLEYQEHVQHGVLSSCADYNTTTNSHVLEGNNANAIDIDEAIAWAKEKFHGCSSNHG